MKCGCKNCQNFHTYTSYNYYEPTDYECMVKDDAVIIDVGITRVENKIYGDVSFDEVYEKASLITKVPGGVGPMTVICLMENTLNCYKLQKNVTQM